MLKADPAARSVNCLLSISEPITTTPPTGGRTSQPPSSMKFLARLINAGDPGRLTRFHTSQNDQMPLSGLLDLPLCVWQTLMFKAFGTRPIRPWIPYAAARFLARRIGHTWRILEIGSGMSTLWLAQRCAQVDSIEADQRWVELLSAEIARRKVANAKIHFRWQAAEMCDFSAWADSRPDLVFIDGGPRPQCLVAALAVVKPGGLVYVDNTDLASTAQNCRNLLEAHAQAHDCTIRIFRGLVPCNLFVNEGMLIQVPAARP